MLAFYIFLVNGLTHGVYVIESYNKETRVLAKENRILETNFAESGFLGKVTKKANELSFEKTTKVKYIEMANNSLANAQ